MNDVQPASAASPWISSPSSLSRNEFQIALSRAAQEALWPAALGLGLVYLFTAISHAIRLPLPVRDPLVIISGSTALIYLLLAVVLRRKAVALPKAHAIGALLAVLALGNEFIQQFLIRTSDLQIYNSLFLLAVGVLFLSTRWFILCLLLGYANWGVAVWREGFGGPTTEWAYTHLAATAIGFAAHFIRRRMIHRMELLRLADAMRTAELQQALRELRENELLFRQFADHSGQVFWINDGRTHRVAYINRVYEELVGRTIERLRVDPLDWLGAVHPEDRPRISRTYLDCTNTHVFDERYRIVRPDGSVRWVHDHGFLIRDETGSVSRIGGIMRDVTDRVHAEQKLQISEQTNRAMLHAIPDMILRVRSNGSYIVVQTPKNFDASWIASRMESHNLRELLPGPLLAVGEAHVAAALATGKVQTHEYRWPDESSDMWREWRIASVAADEVLILVRDITARKAAEIALTGSRQRLSDLIADIDGVVWECDPHTFQFSFVSTRAEKLLGFPISDWLEKPTFFPDFIHPDDRARILQFSRERIAMGLDHEMDYRVIAADGRVLWMHDKARVVKDAAGVPIRLCGILIDITESMRAAQALRDNQAVLDRAQEIAQVGSWTWELHRDRVTWSAQMYRIYGITPEQFDASWIHAFEMIHPDDQQRIWQVGERALASGIVEPFEYRILRSDGSERTVRADGELHRDEQGRTHRIIGTVQDITDLRRAEAEKERLEYELRQSQKLEAVGTLATGVAHDFNNLLTAINGYVDLARQSLPDESPALESLDMIELATGQAAGVTQGLLTFGNYNAFEKAVIDITPNIRQSLQLLRRLLPASIELVEDLPEEEEIWVAADAHQLQQIWLNLTVNARDAMPNGGKLIIRVRRMSEGPVNPQDSWHGQASETAVITVSDNGVGMSEQTIARIFEPYFTTKPRGQGTGLGLSIVHGIVSDHGGRVRVQSEINKGTRFTIYLPCCDPPEEKTPGVRGKTLPQGHGELILLAEDNEFVRAVIASSLQSTGYEVLTATEGEEAIRIYREEREHIRLVVLDLDLPLQSGDQCLREIREAGGDLPVILITGNMALAGQIPRKFNEAMLTKPFQVARLVELVDERLAEHRQV